MSKISISLLFFLMGFNVTAAAKRPLHFEAAKLQAQQSSKDIAIFLHGSDWSLLGEHLKKKIWDQQSFAKKIPGFVLLSIDHPEENINKELQKKNSALKTGTHKYPAVILCDKEGLAYAVIHGLAKQDTADEVSKEIRRLKALLKQRHDLWAKADTAKASAKVKYLHEGLEIQDLIRHKDIYNPRIEELKKSADQNKNPYVRRYALNLGEIRTRANQLVAKDKRDEALALIDKEINHPQNSLVPSQIIQDLHLAKFHIYLRWQGHKEKRFQIMKDLAAVDSKTHLGIGALGYLMMHRKGGPASMSYGWTPVHTKAGKQVLTVDIDSHRFFDHQGKYKLTLHYGGGKGSVEIHEVALYHNNEKMSSASKSKQLSKGIVLDYPLEIKNFTEGMKVKLKVTMTCEQQNDFYGHINVKYLLD